MKVELHHSPLVHARRHAKPNRVGPTTLFFAKATCICKKSFVVIVAFLAVWRHCSSLLELYTLYNIRSSFSSLEGTVESQKGSRTKAEGTLCNKICHVKADAKVMLPVYWTLLPPIAKQHCWQKSSVRSKARIPVRSVRSLRS